MVRQHLISLSIVVFALHTFAQKDDSAVLATINNAKITVSEFNKKFGDLKSKAINAPTKEQFLEDLVRFEVGSQEAQKRKIEDDPVIKERIKEEVYKGLLEKELTPAIDKITVNDAEMKEAYKTNPEIRSSHILIEVKAGATPEQREEAKKRANEILEEVKTSKRPFADLVKLYSDDTMTKANGGDVGFQSAVTTVPAYYDAISKMAVGEVKGLIDTTYGYHIVKVTEKRTYANANKRQLRAAVYDEKRKKIFNDYFAKLKKSYSIKTNPTLLK